MPFRVVTHIESTIASAGNADELSIVRVRAKVIKRLMFDKDARCGEVEPGTEELLKDADNVHWRRRSWSKTYETTGKTWTRGLHGFIQDIDDASLEEPLVGVEEHVTDGVLVGDVDGGNVHAAQRILGGDIAWLRRVHRVLLELIRRQEIHRVAADSFAELSGVGGSRGGSRAPLLRVIALEDLMVVAALAPADAMLGLVTGKEPGSLLVAVAIRLAGEDAHVDGGGVNAIVVQQRMARAPSPNLRVPRVLHEDVAIVNDDVEDVLRDKTEHGFL